MTNKMAKVPSLGGKPAMQAMAAATSSKSQPMRSPGKPPLSGKPAGTGTTQKAKQPKGKGKPNFKQGTVKGIKRKAVSNIKGM